DFLSKSARSLESKIKSQVDDLIQKKDYLLACEILKTTLAEAWSQRITDEFGQRAAPSGLHRAIISLRQRLIITTNFDKLLETAWESLDERDTHYPSTLTVIDENVFKSLKDHSRKYIIKIHGTVDNPNSLVFSRSEYIRSAFGNLRYTEFLESLLLNYTFLFIGFSMNDPAITSLMEMYALKFPTARPHYIFAAGPIAENIIEINKRLRKLVHIVYDPANDHAELTLKVSELAKSVTERRRGMFAEWIGLTSGGFDTGA
ncbi:MAG: SIR2 family protein, partial [Acetobacteraceae bacterium]|nr:SIR2 family protein [Acetobacteraceae bacterium]